MTAFAQTKSVEDIDVASKTVLVRVDYNVPLHPGTTEISDDSRIRASLPTVRHLINQRSKVLLCSHLGRPNGKIVEELRMAPVARRLSHLLRSPVTQAPDCVGPEVASAVESTPVGGVILLENLRFRRGEEQNDPRFASALASLAEVFVNDAFGTAHRAHASTEGVTRLLPSVAGLLMARELEMLGRALQSPQRPLAVVLGGAKVSDKIGVLENLVPKADALIIGGGMAATFLKATGLEVGDSPVEEDRLELAAALIRDARSQGRALILPVDVVVGDAFAATAAHRSVEVDRISPGWRIMDIGPLSVGCIQEALSGVRTVLWNGPMGVFEWEPYAQGTVRVANILANLSRATTVIGGGSTAEAVERLGLADKMTHVSTGGGASLEFLGGKELPGVAALQRKDRSSPAQAVT